MAGQAMRRPNVASAPYGQVLEVTADRGVRPTSLFEGGLGRLRDAVLYDDVAYARRSISEITSTTYGFPRSSDQWSFQAIDRSAKSDVHPHCVERGCAPELVKITCGRRPAFACRWMMQGSGW